MRSPDFPLGFADMPDKDQQVVRSANIVTKHTMKLLEAANKTGVLCSLEQPWNSVMLHTPDFKKLDHEKCLRNLVDYCMYSMPYRKRTAIICWSGGNFLEGVARTCDRTHKHLFLSNWAGPGKQKEPTKLRSAEYPDELCAIWADLVACACV